LNVRIIQKIKPIKLAFFIKGYNRNSYLECVGLCSSLWGGVYNPIIPYFQRFSADFRRRYVYPYHKKEYYSDILDRFEVDYIIYDDLIQEIDLKHSIVNDVELIPLSKFRESFEEEVNYGISMGEIIEGYFEAEFKFKRIDEAQFIIAKTSDSDVYLRSLFGSFPLHYFPTVLSKHPVKSFEINRENYNSFLKHSFKTVFDICRFNLQQESVIERPIVYCVDQNSVEDLIHFWNLRALGYDVLLISLVDLTKKYFKNAIETVLSKNIEKRIPFLISNYFSEAEINQIEKFVEKINTKSKSELFISKTILPYWGRYWPSNPENVFLREVYYDLVHINQELSEYISLDVRKPFPKSINEYSCMSSN